jgi:hypothetical protein
MIASSILPSKFVPSFSFVTDRGREVYRTDKAVEVMRAAYGRRNRLFTPADEALVSYALQAAQEAEAGA